MSTPKLLTGQNGAALAQHALLAALLAAVTLASLALFQMTTM
jgi:Flp pilus assembly pilin Flp